MKVKCKIYFPKDKINDVLKYDFFSYIDDVLYYDYTSQKDLVHQNHTTNLCIEQHNVWGYGEKMDLTFAWMDVYFNTK